MTAVLNGKDNANEAILYMALELSNKKWKLGFSDGVKQRQVTIEAGNWLALHTEIDRAKEKFNLATGCRIVSCYEAGRDGFWIHRRLLEDGIDNLVVDSSSIEVNRRSRRAKTDGVDVKGLLRLLIRYWQGERAVMSVVRVPTVEEEDDRRLHRERERLLTERGSHSARIKSLLVAHGLRLEIRRDFLEQLSSASSGGGYPLGAELKAELEREYKRYQLVDEQIKGLEAQQQARVAEPQGPALEQIALLLMLKGVGQQSSWILVMEFFSWRGFKNQRQVGACAGLTPTPYNSGDSEREQGISKAGNRRVRTLMIELSWMWLRYQPDSALSQWFERRFAHGGKRMRRIGIVALARKLLIALWRYVEEGLVPEGAVFKPVKVAA
jgi:transposase